MMAFSKMLIQRGLLKRFEFFVNISIRVFEPTYLSASNERAEAWFSRLRSIFLK
jgi:hypothetical protein